MNGRDKRTKLFANFLLFYMWTFFEHEYAMKLKGLMLTDEKDEVRSVTSNIWAFIALVNVCLLLDKLQVTVSLFI